MSSERRLRKRVTLSVYLPATDAHLNAPLGHIIDINAAGFLLLSEQSLPVSSSYSVNIQLPKSIEDIHTINVIAQCLRSKPSVKPHFYESAFEITYASLQTKRIIENLQQYYRLHMPQQ